MTNPEKISFLNKIIGGQVPNEDEYPHRLFKYRPFDGHAMEMLKNGTMFLCEAEKLDDESECLTSVSGKDISRLSIPMIKYYYSETILSFIKPYTTKENYEVALSLLRQIIQPGGYPKSNQIIDLSYEIKKLAPESDTVTLVNLLRNADRMFPDLESESELERLLLLGLNARNQIGVCSLTMNENSDEMWDSYASKRTGYCIEYTIDSYPKSNNLFPVIYQEEREFSLVTQLVNNAIGQYIRMFSKNQIQPDVSQFLRLFLTKYPKWSSQNEWRFIDKKPNASVTAPPISKIYIGKNMESDNRDQLINFCKEKGIDYRFN